MIDVTLTGIEELQPYSVFSLNIEDTVVYKSLGQPESDGYNTTIPVVRVEAVQHPNFINRLEFKVIPGTLQSYEFDDSDEVYVFDQQD